LSGKTHNVHTGVCILYGQNKHVFVQTTAVTFKKLSDEEISQYVQSGAPMDKAGAYGIQECGFVESFVGSYDNVVGFPTEQVAKIIEKYKG
ncbi:MAG: Maf family protein, partial [Candidatus Fimimonas sp.]